MNTTGTRLAWTRVCAVTDIPAGEATTLDIDPPIAVFHVDGSFYAVDDTCTHDTYSLAEGYIEGRVVECALHLAKFDLTTGEALCLPARIAVRTYPVKTENGEIFVDVSQRG